MTDLAGRIRSALREAADPVRAPGQQAYMKSVMPFLGVTVPDARRIARAAATEEGAGEILEAARGLWDEASHREERYAAMALLGVRMVRREPAVPELVEHMVRTGAWWDYTDELAHRLADRLDDDPGFATPLVRAWADDPDPWIRRIAIISQVGRKQRVDAALLAAAIVPSLDDPEFFLRKAIGWALRDYARVAPDWVRAFVAAHDLSPLSRREALKHLA